MGRAIRAVLLVMALAALPACQTTAGVNTRGQCSLSGSVGSNSLDPVGAVALMVVAGAMMLVC